ncbi:sporulation protein YqfC [Thermoanaerobacterium saccharolyticum]|jgi:sporulation protein YqfC|uniref:Sporulation protein YqfC n=3 Tax=Thermoanaerobacterium TaxID=28895 RepID=W9EGY9_9THEO|nr:MULTISPECIES: sporulation protein YqfC [Thermoanaerobacterium]AEF17536.1 sporulation protein YqfC [Thermoanaerobacterium xylanolyticum LX-11]AFK87054.1 sporulation protein YqfC [Thermoanaerobacterium saccharolyticum JW/SL-YS485]ETO38974.1 sporulation protein YqfC [Thermoanaerobacterium aotearoense SCUT27]MDE4541595.1 sporulation protein YqfC [Thermoanaerobacterium sp. R66]ORX23427.1 sporulation protein YqfC [Thermoanaerobacterium sp. PSU-2]
MKSNTIKEGILNLVDFPKDVLLNLPKITVIGNTQITVENHRGIIEYIPERIRINSTIGMIRITGKNMIINSVMTEILVITGKILNIEIIV